MATVDVTVIGGGIFGLAVAEACADRGARVRLIESRAIGAGSSGGLVGALAPHVPESWNDKKAFQLESLLMGEAYWARIAALSGIDPGYARTGRLQPLADEAALDLARSRAEGARELWRGRAEWRVVPAGSFPGWSPHSPSGFVVHDTLSARIAPRRAAAALAGAIRVHGGEIVLGEARAEGRVVWATGYEGLAALSAALGRDTGTGVKGQSLSVRHEAARLPQIFGDGLHLIPHDDGTVAIGSSTERHWDQPDTTDAETVEGLRKRAVGLCPALDGAAVVERWAGVRPRAQSRAPVLGPWPDRPGHYIANGGFKIGLGVAPMVGVAMAALVLEDEDRIPPGFRPDALGLGRKGESPR
ncbi:MAG: FAD-binding oxidoreductase [Paracoccaceae bacterium]